MKQFKHTRKKLDKETENTRNTRLPRVTRLVNVQEGKENKLGNMINLRDLIYIHRNLLSEDQCNQIIKEYHESPTKEVNECCPHAFTGENIYSPNTVKGARIETEVFKLIHNSIETVINEYHEYMDGFNSFHVDRRLNLLYPHLYRLMKYEVGQWIHPHTDHDAHVYGSCTINLNEEYDGGLFSFWGGKHKIKLNRGDCMIWPADNLWVHEVEQITKGTRYSVNCFLRDSPQHLPSSVSYNIRTNDELMNYRIKYFKENCGKIDEIKSKYGNQIPT